jgi:hypothetical protein
VSATAGTGIGPNRRSAQPQDAVILDSTAMTLDEVLARAEEIVLTHLPLVLTAHFGGRSIPIRVSQEVVGQVE